MAFPEQVRGGYQMARSWFDFHLKTGSDCALLEGKTLSLPFAVGSVSKAVWKAVPR